MTAFIKIMKKEIINKAENVALGTSKDSVFSHLNTNRNTFDALSEIGMVCGVFGGMLGLSLVLMSSFFGALAHLYNVGFMLVFFSAVLLMNGAGNRFKMADSKAAHKMKIH